MSMKTTHLKSVNIELSSQNKPLELPLSMSQDVHCWMILKCVEFYNFVYTLQAYGSPYTVTDRRYSSLVFWPVSDL